MKSYINTQRTRCSISECMIYVYFFAGQFKTVPVPVKALGSFLSYMKYGMDARPSDVIWNCVNPFWSYGITLI